MRLETAEENLYSLVFFDRENDHVESHDSEQLKQIALEIAHSKLSCDFPDLIEDIELILCKITKSVEKEIEETLQILKINILSLIK